MRHLLLHITIILAVGFMTVLEASAQCRAHTQRYCIPKLDPYRNNGRINSTMLFNGDSATMRMTFFSLQEYQLRLCTGDALPNDAYFEVKDMNGKLLYSTKGKPSFWNFSVRSTRSLQIKVVVPYDPSIEKNTSDCAAIILGFKPD